MKAAPTAVTIETQAAGVASTPKPPARNLTVNDIDPKHVTAAIKGENHVWLFIGFRQPSQKRKVVAGATTKSPISVSRGLKSAALIHPKRPNPKRNKALASIEFIES